MHGPVPHDAVGVGKTSCPEGGTLLGRKRYHCRTTPHSRSLHRRARLAHSGERQGVADGLPSPSLYVLGIRRWRGGG